MKRFVLVLLIFLPVISCTKSTPVSSIRIGLVNFVVGNAYIIGQNNVKVPARTGMPVDKGMKVATTGAQSICEIYFNDNAIKIQGDSLLDIDSLSSGDRKSENTALTVEKGKVFTHVTKLRKEDVFTLKTSTCVAAVRGTDFLVAKTGSGSTVSCLDGKVEVVGSRDTAVPVIIARQEEALSDGSAVNKNSIQPAALDQLKGLSAIGTLSEENRITFEKIAAGDSATIDTIMKLLHLFHDPLPAAVKGKAAVIPSVSRVDDEPVFFESIEAVQAVPFQQSAVAAAPVKEGHSITKEPVTEPQKKAIQSREPVTNIQPQNKSAAGGQMVPPVDINPEYLK
jgi:hypothetical protein